VAPRGGDRVAVRAEILDGDVPLEAVERRLLELRERYRVREIATDRGAFLRSAELLAARAMPVVETPHSPERLSIVRRLSTVCSVLVC